LVVKRKMGYKLSDYSAVELKQMPKGRRRHQWTGFKPKCGHSNMAFEVSDHIMPVEMGSEVPTAELKCT